jgi:hypothetical protein
MAKGKKAEVACCVTPDYKERVRVCMSATDLKKLSIGDEIEVMLKGTVVGLEERKHWDDDKKIIREVCIEQEGKNVFAELAEDD